MPSRKILLSRLQEVFQSVLIFGLGSLTGLYAGRLFTTVVIPLAIIAFSLYVLFFIFERHYHTKKRGVEKKRWAIYGAFPLGLFVGLLTKGFTGGIIFDFALVLIGALALTIIKIIE